jgi:hypothetical protein
MIINSANICSEIFLSQSDSKVCLSHNEISFDYNEVVRILGKGKVFLDGAR